MGLSIGATAARGALLTRSSTPVTIPIMAILPVGAVFQFRKGSEVLLARAGGVKGDKVLATGEDGRKVELPRDRVLQAAGEIPGAPTDQEVRVRLREVRGAAEALAPAVDLKLLWEMVRAEPDGAPVEDLVALYHGRSGSPAERLAFGFALCEDRIYFRQKGERFAPRMESEVEVAIERLEAERRAAERRAAFLGWARAGIQGGAMHGPPPEGSASELAAIEDLAVRGDEAPQGARARAVMKDIAAGLAPNAPRFAASADGAFDLLVRLGIFTEHENLAVRRTGIPAAFAPPLLALASEVPSYLFDAAAEPLRRDLRALEVVTIDDAETADRDDAVSLEPAPDGRFRLGVHIADVARFIPPGSPLDDEAVRRGTTVYLPRGKLAMFPAVLSEGRMSLDTGGDRPVLSFFFTLSPDLAIEREDVEIGCVRVARNLSYEDADRALAEPHGPLGWLATVRDLGERLTRARAARGALQLQTADLKVAVDAEGRVHVKRVEARSPAREMVAELMILANVTAARFCRERGIPAVYRRQDAPAEPLPARDSAPSPEVWAFEVRRRLARTELGAAPGGHFSLALDCYLQVTSPIRRYQDLAMERQIEAALAGAPLPYGPDDILRIAGSAEAAAGESNAVERETTTYWLLRYLEQRRGTPEDAVVIMAREGEGRFLVELVETGIRGFVRPRGARWALGDRVKVRVEGLNARRNDVNLAAA
jgi:exoribonuclease-2